MWLPPDAARRPLCQARCCVAGLVILAFLRGLAIAARAAPSTGRTRTAHLLSFAADGIAICGALPALLSGMTGPCVQRRCLGSLLTLLLAAALTDISASIAIFGPGGAMYNKSPDTGGGGGAVSVSDKPWGLVATDEGAPASAAFFGIWDCILVASLSLEVALFVSSWQLYRAFREAGAYPPGASGAELPRRVSWMELMCEAEDAALIRDSMSSACSRSQNGSSVCSSVRSRPTTTTGTGSHENRRACQIVKAPKEVQQLKQFQEQYQQFDLQQEVDVNDDDDDEQDCDCTCQRSCNRTFLKRINETTGIRSFGFGHVPGPR